VRIEQLEVEDAHRVVFEDPLVEQIVETAHGPNKRPLIAFVTQALRDYTDAESLTGRKPSLRKLASKVQKSKSEQGPLDQICTGIEGLYRKFDPGAVRGVLLEALVERSIKARYGGGDDTLTNNLRFRVEDDNGESHETSTSIDVIGVCAKTDAGECIDCKVRSRSFKSSWVDELIDDVGPFGFRIGLATADSTRTARGRLKHRGITLRKGLVLVTPDNWTTLPLLP
jgi:hypothetical protein